MSESLLNYKLLFLDCNELKFTATIRFCEIAPRLTFFNLRSSTRQMTMYEKAIEDDDRNVYNKYVYYKPDAMWSPYARVRYM